MKLRKEISGLHLFNRKTGLHVLMNEISIKNEDLDISPRVVSIALTNICDLKCHFCYAPKTKDVLDIEYLKELCKKLDELNVLELTFGGGEPTLHPDFVDLCKWIWANTTLGISFTTHGHKVTPEFVREIQGNVSMVRFSIDGIEPRYSQIRGKSLNSLLTNIKNVQGKIPFGVNCVVSKEKIGELKNVIELSIKVGAENVLIIPEHSNGVFLLSGGDWNQVNRIIKEYDSKIEILITHEAANYINRSTLPISDKKEYLFAHISAKKLLKRNSYDLKGEEIIDIDKLDNYFKKIRQNENLEIICR